MATKDAVARANSTYNKKRLQNVTSIQIPRELHTVIKEMAAAENCTIAEMVQKLIENFNAPAPLRESQS